MHSTVTESLPTSRADLLSRLATVRARTLALVESLSEDALNRVHDPLMSPIVWDLGHVATFEDLWLAQNAFGVPPLREGLDRVYDPFTAPRSERAELPYLRSEVCLGYLRGGPRAHARAAVDGRPDVRRRAAARGRARLRADPAPREQHSETILQTLQIMTAEAYTPPRAAETATAPKPAPKEMVLVPGGTFEMGAPAQLRGTVFAYDNELPRARGRHSAPSTSTGRPSRTATSSPSSRTAATTGPSSGRRPAAHGSREKDRRLPRYWSHDADGFAVRSFADVERVDPGRPLCHV